MSVKAPGLNTLTNTQQPRRGVKSPCTRSQTRRAQESSPQATTSANAEPVARFEELPDELRLATLRVLGLPGMAALASPALDPLTPPPGLRQARRVLAQTPPLPVGTEGRQAREEVQVGDAESHLQVR